MDDIREAAKPEAFEVRREGLLDRLERVRPKLVALIAPAGFGKSTLARQYLASRGAAGVCDCNGVRDDLDLARRLIPALAAENPEREQLLTRRELMLGDGGTSVAERVNIALAAWREAGPESTFVFENAEHLVGAPSARELFSRLLAVRPESRSVLICSRENLRVHLTRFAAPHEIMVLRANDLAFDDEGVRAIFQPLVGDRLSIDRIAAVSQGWPIAVLLLKRFATEDRIGKLLDRLGDVAFEELHDYLADEVLGSLDGRAVQAIFACACIPRADANDLRAAFAGDDVAFDLAEFVKDSPFVVRDTDGTFTVHPLLASLLLEHQAERRSELLRRVAVHYESVGEFQRAAELHLARADQAAAASALGRHEVVRDASPSMQYATVLSALDRSLVQRYPRLWGVTALMRMFCVDTEELLDEAESIWRTLPAEVSPVERYYIFVFRVLLMSYLGMFDEALLMIDAFAAASAKAEMPAAAQTLRDGYILYLRALLTARMGHLAESEKGFMTALSTIEHMDVMAAGTYLTLGADIARVRGERAVERTFIERAIARARDSGLSNFVAFDLAEALFGAWLAGEDDAFNRYAKELDETVDRYGVRGFGYLAAAACGRESEPVAVDNTKYVAFGRLIALANAADERGARRCARSAYTLAEQCHSPFIECLGALAIALTDETAYSEYIEKASTAAQCCESPALLDAVRAIAEHRADAGMLAAFVRRLTRERATLVPVIEIEIVTGTVRVAGAPVALSGRELELIVALSVRHETVPRVRLSAMLWPDLEEFAARNALSVCLHRLRKNLGREDTILRDGDGYRLHADARVDFWEIERITSIVRSRTTVLDTDREMLKRIAQRMRQPRNIRMKRWEWFEPIERRLRELQIDVAQRLATDALDRGDALEALQFAGEMIEHDPCDEPAREIAIRAHLSLGDRAAALRQFRQYRETLMAELQCEPSPALAALVG